MSHAAAPSPSHLRWHCRRGMRELDVLLERYLEQRYPSADATEQAAFVELLAMEDPELYAICLRRLDPPTHLKAVFDQVRPAA